MIEKEQLAEITPSENASGEATGIDRVRGNLERLCFGPDGHDLIAAGESLGELGHCAGVYGSTTIGETV